MKAPITRLTLGALWVLLLGVLAAPIIYGATWPVSEQFIDNVMSGLLATAAALIGGIPVALWIDRAIKHREETKKKEEERKRELELLELIREELSFTNSQLGHRQGNITNLPIQPLKSDLWAAISAAGKLNLISSHRLLNRIASAYYVIDVVRRIEEQGYLAARSATVTFPGGMTGTQLLLQDARGFDQLLSDSIKEALREIDEELSKKPNYDRRRRNNMASEGTVTLLLQRREHQDNLIHTRLNWLAASQSFLFTAYAISTPTSSRRAWTLLATFL